MASVEVYRGAGDRPGAPIIEPMLAGNVLVDRGRAEMDSQGQRSQRIEADVLFRAGLRPGQLLELDDPTAASQRLAKLTGISVRLEGGRIDCALTLEEPQP